MAKAKKPDPVDFDNFDSMVDGMIKEVDFASDVSGQAEWVSSGNIAINLALSGTPTVALPFGRIINLEGESDTGKTLIAQTVMREAQTKFESKFRGLYIDVERGIALQRLEGMGMFVRRKPKDPNNPRPEEPYFEDTTGDPRAGTFRPVRTTDLTSLCEKILPSFLAAARANPDMMCILCIDSVTMLMTSHERDTEFETRDMTRSQELRKMMRQINDSFVDNLMVLLIHHQSDVIRTNQYEPVNDSREMKKTISGGKSVKYVPDVRIEVSYGGKEMTTQKELVGQTARIQVIKTRLYKPMIKAEATIDHNVGFTRTGGLWDQMKQLGLIVKSGNMFQCPLVTGEKKFYTDAMKQALESDENVPKVVDAILKHMTVAAHGGEGTLDDGETLAETPAGDDAFAGLE